MKNCEQTKGQSVLDHGISVKNWTFDLINHLRNGDILKNEWILPDWVYENRDLILENLPSDKTLKYYTILHDCGKPYCLETDDLGKRHFPNHSEVSYRIFKNLFVDGVSARLIKDDMEIHLLKSEDIDDFCQNPHALTLLIVGLSEIHSNSEMFGGKNSDSFKIKLKRITQRGKKIIQKIKQNNENKRLY